MIKISRLIPVSKIREHALKSELSKLDGRLTGDTLGAALSYIGKAINNRVAVANCGSVQDAKLLEKEIVTNIAKMNLLHLEVSRNESVVRIDYDIWYSVDEVAQLLASQALTAPASPKSPSLPTCKYKDSGFCYHPSGNGHCDISNCPAVGEQA